MGTSNGLQIDEWRTAASPARLNPAARHLDHQQRLLRRAAPMGENDDSCSGNPDPKWIVGVVCCMLGSMANATGFVLQKWAHTEDESLPEEERAPRFGSMLCSPMWMLGFLLAVFLSLPLDILAIMFVPQSVNATLSGFTIICTQV